MLNQITKSLTKAITGDLLGIAKEFAELKIDDKLSDGIFKEFPLIGNLISVMSIGVKVRDKFLLKKIVCFLDNISEIPREKRVKFICRVNNNTSNFSEKLLLVIDRIDTIEKTKIISNLLVS